MNALVYRRKTFFLFFGGGRKIENNVPTGRTIQRRRIREHHVFLFLFTEFRNWSLTLRGNAFKRATSQIV